MSSEYTFDDTAISDISDQSVIDITDDRNQKSNGGPIRNNKTSSSSSEINEFFIRTKDSQKCRICATVYSSSISTGTLKKHLEKKHPTEYQRKFTQTTLNFQHTHPYSRKENFEKSKNLIDWIVTSLQPFSVIEEDYFIEMIKKFDPRYRVPNHKYIKKYVINRFENWRKILKYDIEKIKSGISLTTDMWTSDNSHTAFFGVTCHYIDDNWTLRHFLLDIIPFHESHTGKNMAQTLTNLLSELNLSSKAFAITTDNAAAMLVCRREMKNELKNTFNNINFSHFRCGVHILNLVVQHGLQVHDASVDKVRKFMIKVRNSNKLLEDLWHIFESQSIEFLSPQLDINTR
ncbi:unnamed protein product [Rhizophagus irregularis]|nr:unnamed protein product [Rhizophagus irregularis]